MHRVVLACLSAFLFSQATGVTAVLQREPRSCQTALQIIEGTAELNNFVSILRQTRLAGLLNDPAFPATVFAVRNEALANLPRLLSTNSSLATEQVKALAHYHVLPFSLSKALKFDASAKQFTTMLGQPISLRLDAAPMVSGAQNSSIILSSKLAPACQAEVYIVDGVLLPDLAQLGSGSATQAAAQGLKMIRAAPSRRLLARADSAPKTTSSTPGIKALTTGSQDLNVDKASSKIASKAGSLAGHTDAPHHHTHDESAASSSAAAAAGSSGKGSSKHHPTAKGVQGLAEEETIGSLAGKKGPANPKAEAGVAADGKKSKKQQREAEAERQALAVPEITTQEAARGSNRDGRQELSTLTTSSGEGMADSKHTTVSAGSRADKQEPKDELDSLGATTPDDLSEDGQVGAESADLTKGASTAASKKASAAGKALENDLQAVYSHSHKKGKKGTGVLKSIMGIFSGGDSSEADFGSQHRPDSITSKHAQTSKGTSKPHGESASRAKHAEQMEIL